MKKNLLFLPLVLMALTGVMAAGPWSTISLKKKPGPVFHPQLVPNPLSATEDDNFFSLEAELS